MYFFILSAINLFRIVLMLLLAVASYPFTRQKAIHFFLRFCGPSFIKLGQLLSTRPDLVGENLAQVLSVFQDKLPPFSFKKVKKIVENEFSKKLENLFIEFSPVPIASASVAQVHKAKISGNIEVAVKVLRPNISKSLAIDIITLELIAKIIGIFSRYNKERVFEIVDLLKICEARELDMTLEASSASDLKEKLKDVKGFYIPKVYWNFTSRKILTLEWINGIAFSDYEKIKSNNLDKKEIAKNLVISYFNQVYVHGFFHADMHPGNLFLMENGDIGVVDFGIVGIINKKTRIAVAEILIGFLKRDYKQVAKLHINNGLVPENTNLEEFSLTCRAIGESIVDVPIKKISLAKLLTKLIKMTKKYNLTTKPELLLLQKTMMLVEGVGSALDDNLNMWELARPWMKEWATKNIGFDAKIRDGLLELFAIIKKIPLAAENIDQDKPDKLQLDLLLKIKEISTRERIWKISTFAVLLILIISLIIK